MAKRSCSLSRSLFTSGVILLLAFFGDLGGEAAPAAQRPCYRVYGDTFTRAGKTVALDCELDGFPPFKSRPPSYQWLKDGEVIPGQSSSRLALHSVTRQDKGNYQCGPSGSDVDRKGLDLHVFVPGDVVSRPEIVKQQDGLAVCGRPYSLHCMFLSVPYIVSRDTVFTWYKDSAEVKGQSGEVLWLHNVTEADGGLYSCTAREGPVESTSPPSIDYDLTVFVPPQVHIKPSGPMVKGILGEILTLTCEVTRAFPKVPTDGYSWSYLPFPHGTQRPLEGKAKTLTLGPLTREDRGQYFCQARNDQLFQITKMSGDASVTVDVVYLENITLTPGLEVKEGDHVTLTCEVDSHPTARLAWTVNGQEVRHVTDNLDHYVIMSAACSDSTNYTCGASNTETPGREKHATTRVHVHCTQVLQEEGERVPTPDKTLTEVFATLHFSLPRRTSSIVVVHPGGRDLISVRQDCSFHVTSTFMSRLQPRCDLERHRLTFTLTSVTGEDEGDYICMEEGTQRQIPNCGTNLLVQKVRSKSNHQNSTVLALAVSGVVALLIGMALGTKYYHKVRSLVDRLKHVQIRQQLTEDAVPLNVWEKSQDIDMKFESLYEKGNVYVFPRLVIPKETAASSSEDDTEDESKHLLGRKHVLEEDPEFKVKDLLRITLQKYMSTNKEDLPSFLLHNTRLNKRENVMLILDRKMGVIVMMTKSNKSMAEMSSLEVAATHLVEALETVRCKLQGLVESSDVTAVLALPFVTNDQADDVRKGIKILRTHPDVQILPGQDQDDYRQWMERLRTERANKVWRSSSQGGDDPDTVYKMAARSFLTLAGCDGTVESPHIPDPAQSWLLTPDQMEVRHSTARLLHIWGPPGSGKTMLLVHRVKQWLADGKAVVLAVGKEFYDVKLAQIAKAVKRDQKEEAISRLHVCCTYQEIERTVKNLSGRKPQHEICIVVDILRRDIKMFSKMLSTVRSKEYIYVWSTRRGNITKEALQLGWESIQLPDCIRCTKNTVGLLNMLGEKVYPPIPSCSGHHPRNIRGWRVVDHCLHPDHANTLSRCNNCKTEMSQVLPSMEQGPRWSDWIALHTGNLHIAINYEDLNKALLYFGVPSFYESNAYLRHENATTSSAPPPDAPVHGVPENAPFRERVINGVDTAGKPAMHLVEIKEFTGMERDCVILVHWDERDNIPEHQIQQERNTRLREHRHQWIHAVSRSKGQVILLLLTPSPARSLLGLPEPVMAEQRGVLQHASSLLETQAKARGLLTRQDSPV